MRRRHAARRRIRPVTSDEITLRRFGTIVLAFLALLQISQAAVRAQINAPVRETHMQNRDPGLRLQKHIAGISVTASGKSGIR
jgi:hypothetical protein